LILRKTACLTLAFASFVSRAIIIFASAARTLRSLPAAMA
jgi:hypothetical protein